jgi:hypothetical protein
VPTTPKQLQFASRVGTRGWAMLGCDEAISNINN